MEQIFSEDKKEGRKGKFKYMQQKGEGYRVAAVLDAGYVNMDTLMMAGIGECLCGGGSGGCEADCLYFT